MLGLVKKVLSSVMTEQNMYNKNTSQLLENVLACGESIQVLYLELIQFELLEEDYGEQYAQRFLLKLKEVIGSELQKLLKTGMQLRTMYNLWGDDFVITISGKEDVGDSTYIYRILAQFEQDIEKAFSTRFPKYAKSYKGIRIGCSCIKPPVKQFEKRYYRAIKEAYRTVKNGELSLPAGLANEFGEILQTKKLKSVFQSIISLETGEDFGWEALTRGPKDSFFHSPKELFTFAEKSDTLFSLESLARELSIQNIGDIQPYHKLFLNVNPTVIKSADFHRGFTKGILKEYGLSPHQIVFELTERTAIEDFKTFRKTLDHYRNQGYMIAVDDAGAGYSSLQTIAEIKPDFIKLDMSITHGVDRDAVKRALLETFVTFTQKINCQLIAEGIETASELSVLTRLGVHYGQGFFINKPDFPKPKVPADIIKFISSAAQQRHKHYRHDQEITAKELVSHVTTVVDGTLIEEVAEIFENQHDLQGVAVVDQKYKPCGFLLRQTLYKVLSSRYGVALYYRKTVEEIMNARPLIIQAETPIEIVAKLAMRRDTQHIYDFIIVVDRDIFLGIITVQNLLEFLTQMKIEQARYANPLTGLPGNVIIEKEIEQRIQRRTSDVVMYIDIDFFKPYNDIYGFEQGDRFILFISKILRHAVKNRTNVFVGHVGGDDFVILCHLSLAHTIAEQILKIFKRLLKAYYNEEDWHVQFMVSTDRMGKSCVYPLSSLSIAGVHIDDRFVNAIQVGERAAFMKSEVKKIPGNAVIIENIN